MIRVRFLAGAGNFSLCAVWLRNLVSNFEEEHRLKVFENRVLRKIVGPKREEEIVEKIA
jgi:hypothetical protein